MNLQEAFEIVYEELKKYHLLMGGFDARHGSVDFMNGIETVMETIVSYIGKEKSFHDEWVRNFERSLKRTS